MQDLTVTAHVVITWGGLTIGKETFTVTTPVTPGTGLTNAQTASAGLQTEIAKYISDVATALASAISGNGPTGDSDADVQAIADAMNADAATLTSADSSLSPPATPVPPTSSLRANYMRILDRVIGRHGRLLCYSPVG